MARYAEGGTTWHDMPKVARHAEGGTTCRRWHNMPMMTRCASGGTICQRWYDIPVVVRYTGGGTSSHKRTSEEKNQSWKSMGPRTGRYEISISFV